MRRFYTQLRVGMVRAKGEQEGERRAFLTKDRPKRGQSAWSTIRKLRNFVKKTLRYKIKFSIGSFGHARQRNGLPLLSNQKP